VKTSDIACHPFFSDVIPIGALVTNEQLLGKQFQCTNYMNTSII